LSVKDNFSLQTDTFHVLRKVVALKDSMQNHKIWPKYQFLSKFMSLVLGIESRDQVSWWNSWSTCSYHTHWEG